MDFEITLVLAIRSIAHLLECTYKHGVCPGGPAMLITEMRLWDALGSVSWAGSCLVLFTPSPSSMACNPIVARLKVLSILMYGRV